MTLFDSDFAPRERPAWTRRKRAGAILVAFGTLCALVFGFTPSPYVIEQPGPVYDTIGTVSVDGKDVPLITVAGAPTGDPSGTLDMLTVSIVGSPDQPLSWLQAGLAWFEPNHALLPMDAIFPVGQTADQQQQQNQAQMVDSQQEAIAAALTALGYEVGRSVVVSGLADGAAASGLLQTDDVILEANGVPLQSVDELKAQVNARNGAAVDLLVKRAGRSTAVSVVPSKASNGSYVLGIGATVTFTFPIQVTIQLDNVGGPSAGMMFALGIIAKLTPGTDFVGGKLWAGTGTIDAAGTVGPIGGIRQKMAGARSAGAAFMLAPRDNCDEVTGHIPAGLEVFAVSTLAEAQHAVETVAAHGDTSQLPRCPAG